MNDDYFDAKAYAIRVIKAKGYDPAKAADVADVFALQWPFWKELIQKHRLGDDEQRAERLLAAFATKPVIGGVGKVLETFAAHLDAQPKQGGSPDWSQAGREWAECCFCDGRGVVSEIPCKIVRRGEVIERSYSFACVCDGGRRFAGMKVADDWMLNFARDRKQAEIAKVNPTLERYGIDPNADPQTRARQFHVAFRRGEPQGHGEERAANGAAIGGRGEGGDVAGSCVQNQARRKDGPGANGLGGLHEWGRAE